MVRLRRGVVGDAAHLAAVQRASVVGLAPRWYGPREVAAWAAGLGGEAALAEKLGRDLFLVAEREGGVAGFASLAEDELDLLYVHPAHAGRGVGARLVEEIEREARARGVGTLRLRASLGAAPLFTRFGYGVVREAPQAMGGVKVPALDMEKRLDA